MPDPKKPLTYNKERLPFIFWHPRTLGTEMEKDSVYQNQIGGNMKTVKKLLAIATLPAFFLFVGCEKDEITAEDQKASMRVHMTDAPADYGALNVEIAEVSAYSTTSGWVTLSSESRTVNILSLTNGTQTMIGSSAQIQAGNYTQLKIKFGDEHSITLLGQTALLGGALNGVLTLDLNFQGSKEVVVEIDQQVAAGASADVLIDFHAAESVVESAGQYFIRPVITEIQDRATGVRGHVEGAASAMITLTNGEIAFSATTYVSASGDFLIRDVPAGTYTLIAQKVSQAGSAFPDPVTVQGVTVVSGEIRSVGTIQL